jgi:site-specific recombinase XerD
MKDRPVLILLAAKMISALPPALTSLIESFDLALRSERKSSNTRACYIRAAAKFGLWLVDEGVATFADVRKGHIQLYIAWLAETPRPDGKFYADGYVNNQYRALQQFFKWHSAEEDLPNPFAKLSPPKVGEKVVPVIEYETLATLIRLCEKGRDFESRRDAAILRLFASSGIRLSELALLEVDNVDLTKCAAKVTGKGDKERIVRFDDRTAQAINRYLRMRAEHKFARHPRLWLAIKNRGPLTPNGIRQIIERRGLAAGVDIHPHMFRHTFSHNWLDNGGQGGDLMEQNGWTSEAMLRVYGRSMRAARAHRAYDRINVMGDI